MPALSEAIQSLGHHEVATYVQSGNVVFSAHDPAAEETAHDPAAEETVIARAAEAAIAERTGVRVAVIVVSAAELHQVVRDNPFPGVGDPKLLHAVFLPDPPGDAGIASVVSAVARVRKTGTRDDAQIVGRVLYLWAPDGFARSLLRRELDRGGASRTPMREGTARNWSTVTHLAGLLGR